MLSDPETRGEAGGAGRPGADVVKYGAALTEEEVSMSVEWSGVSTVHARLPARPRPGLSRLTVASPLFLKLSTN